MMLIDLFVHTRFTQKSELFPEGVLSHQEAIRRGKEKGLDAICFTEHLHPAGIDEAFAAGKEENFPVFVGVDIPTTRGRLIFIPQNPKQEEFLSAPWTQSNTPKPEEITRDYKDLGVLIALTPYYRAPNTPPMGDRIFLLKNLHAIASLTELSAHDPHAEALAVEAASAKGLAVVGGSDLFGKSEQFGNIATLLRFSATSQTHLCELIKNGDTWSAHIGRAPAPIRRSNDRSGPRNRRPGGRNQGGKPRNDRRRGPRR